MPHTSQPNAASCKTSPMVMLEYVAAAYKTVGGATRFSRPEATNRTGAFSGHGCVNDRGVASRPTRKAREKLSVASVDRNMPRRRREKDLISWYCCVDGL